MESDLEDCEMFHNLPIEERFSLKEIFSVFLGTDINNVSDQVSPSSFTREMLLTTEQRYQKLITPQFNSKYEKNFGLDVIFRPLPRIIIFQSFEPGETYNVTLCVQNIGKALIPLHMVCSASVNFQVTYKSHDVVTRVAPGLSVLFDVKFMPDRAKDYKHEIIFVTELLRFTVPIYAIGPRPMLDFPDAIYVPSTAVKINSSKTVLIKNIGKIQAIFVLSTERPFTVQPQRAVLLPGELMQVIIFFNSSKAGSFNGLLNVNYETGETLAIHLQGNAENENIELSHDVIQFQGTFIGLKRQNIVTLHNTSSYVIQYKWLSAPPEQKKSVTSASECEDNLFSHPNFSVIPQSGEIWPKGSVDTIFIFGPNCSMPYETFCYCEVTGRESCMMLKIIGLGLGPDIVLNLESLDISCIFLGSVHHYEVICMNRGDISGTIIYANKLLLFGGEVQCSPPSYMLAPGEHRSFVLTFSSSRAGDFSEKITFFIKESHEEVAFTMRGRVVTPTLHFTINELDLGEIPIGFVSEQTVTICNSCLVPVVYSMKVESDGKEKSITYEDYSRMGVNKVIPLSPKEFVIDPAESVVEPSSCITVNLTVVPNVARIRATSVVVEIQNSDDPVLLPLRYVAAYPHIIAEPSGFTIDCCFINFPYNRTLTVVNDSDIIGYVFILPQEVNTCNPLTYSLGQNEAVMKPKSKISIPLTVMTSEVGLQSTVIKVLVMGSAEPVDLCKVVCNGRGPVVSAEPNQLLWGAIPLLRPSVRSFRLINSSPIPAPFHITTDNHHGRWMAKPDQGVVEVSGILQVDVVVYLTDNGNFSSRLHVHIANSCALIIRMNAKGNGTSIVTDPPILPEFSVGPIFSHQNVECQVLVTNEGTKHHHLQWSFTLFTSKSARMPVAVSKQSHFEITPTKMSLLPGESAVLTIKATSDREEMVTEELYCYAVIEHTGRPQLIFTASITANIVNPVVVFSKQNLSFYTDVLEYEPITLQDTVTLTNQTILPLTAMVDVDHPFQIVSEDGSFVAHATVHLKGSSVTELNIIFDSNFVEDRYSRVVEGFIHIHFDEHPQMIKFPLRGEVNFPNVKVISEINFGCILLGTNMCKAIVLENVSPLPVEYNWTWVVNSSDISLAENYQNIEERNLSYRNFDFGEETGADSSLACHNILSDSHQLVSENLEEEERDSTDISNLCVKCKLFHLVASLFVEQRDRQALEILPLKVTALPVLKFFELTPHRGHLRPHESKTVWVTFFGATQMTASVQAKCIVKGGPTETITVSAMASSVSYHIDKIYIDFGKQIFLKECQDTVVLQNTGNMSFDFVVEHTKLDACPLDSKFLIEPMSGHLLPGYEAKLIVTFLPGVSGKFIGKFHLEIAYLDPIVIHVEGFGSIPQLYVHLPRPGLLSLPVELGYTEISRIENGWCPMEKNAYDYECPIEEDVMLNDWVLVCETEMFPQVADIELAVERMIAYKHLVKNPTILLHYGSTMHTKPIPELYVPPYKLEVGAVISGIEVNHSILVTNYSPAIIHVRLEKMEPNDNWKECGFSAVFANQRLPRGDSATVSFSLKPPRQICPSNRTDFNISLVLAVGAGAKIMIAICGYVTVPFVTVSPHLVDFKTVTCGFRRVMAVVVKNEGWLPCVWKAELKSRIPTLKKKHFDDTEFIDSAFYINSCEKNFKPGDSELLKIFFTPLSQGEHKAYLVFTMHQNPNKIVVSLQGDSAEPQLTISDTEIYFPPCLPYHQSEARYFTIKNLCAFPVEVFLPDFDRQFHEEERVLEVLFRFYDAKELVLPERTPGDKLSQELLDFYHCVLKKVKVNVATMNEALNSTKYSEEEKNRRKSRRLSNSVLNAAASTNDIDAVAYMSSEEPLSVKNQEEIDTLVAELLDEMKRTGDIAACGNDPLQKALASSVPELTTSVKIEPRNSVLIVFHGAPLTESVFAAHKTGRILGLPVLTVDQIILEQIVYGHTIAGKKVYNWLNTAYNEEIEKSFALQEDGFLQTSQDFEVLNPLEEIVYKIEILEKLYKEKQKKLNDSAVKITKRSHGSASTSSNSRRTTKVTSNGSVFHSRDASVGNCTLANIPQELLIELIAQRLQASNYSKGLVIESLRSSFLHFPPVALAAILAAAKHLSYIFCAILNYSRDSHYKWLSEKELETVAEYEKKLQIIKNLDDSDIDELEADNQALYAQVKLNERRQLLQLRMEERHRKQLEKLEEQRQQSVRKLNEKGKKGKVKSQKNISGEGVRKAAVRPRQVGRGIPAEPAAVGGAAGQESSKTLRKPESSQGSKVVVEHKEDADAVVDIQLESELMLAFNDFQNNLFEIITLLENWDTEKGILLQESSSSDATRDQGIPFWVFNCRSPNSSLVDTFVQVMLENTNLQELLVHLRKQPELLPPATVTYQYVLHREPRSKSGFSNVFPISPVEPAHVDMPHRGEHSDDSDKDTIDLENVKKFKKGKLRWTNKADSSFTPPSTQKVNNMTNNVKYTMEECPKFKTRWLLSPGESVDWKMTFEPKQVGKHAHSYNIEVTGWDHQYIVTGYGTCDIPEINVCPHVIFPRVSEIIPEERTFSPTYFMDTEAFDIGSVIISKPKDKIFHQITGNLTFENVSVLPATIHFSFLDKVTDKIDYFTLEPSVLFVEPGGREVLKVMATPRFVGIISEVLLCSIKDNPRVHQFKIMCSGAKMEFEVDNKNVVFDPSLLHHKDMTIVILRNKSPVPLLWKFYENDSLKNDFEISTTEGVIMPYNMQEVHITYTSSKIQIITKKPIRLEVFLDRAHREPALTEMIYLSAETYDVVVDIQFPHPDDDHLNFGDFLVGQEQQQVLVLKNKGKYDTSFTFTLNKNAVKKNPKLKDMIVINPDSGILIRSERPFSIQIMINPQEEIEIINMPVFTITIFQNKNTVVAMIPIHLSMSASYAKFIVEPLPELNFGPMLVTSNKSLNLSIENIGSYEFKYLVTAANSLADQPPTTTEKANNSKKISRKKGMEKKDSKPPSKVSVKNSRPETNKMAAGVFHVSFPSGTVAPHSGVQLPVECILDAAGHVHEIIFIHISGSSPEFKHGVAVQLLAQGCVPALNYTNTEEIFREHYICDSLDTFEHRNVVVGSYCVFSKDDETLWFRNVCVGKSFTARLRLHNPGLVPSHLTASTGNTVFSVIPEQLTIMPQSTAVLIISFSPTQLELYSTILEIVKEMPATMKSVKVLFNLHGESCIPIVKVTSPSCKAADGHSLIVFEPTMLHQVQSHQFSLCNTGSVPCKVFMEFLKSGGNIFSVFPTKDAMQNVLILIQNEPVQNTTIISLNPGKSSTFDVHFQPLDPGVFEAVLKLYIVDNPFENLRVVLKGYGYQDDVTLEGLNIQPLVNKEHGLSTVQNYHLDLGLCNIGKEYTSTFKITNHCGMSTYRFEWNPHQGIKIVPNMGHLAPNTFRDSSVSFIASEPISFHKVEMVCTVAKIIILDKYKRSSWNSQLMVAKWLREVTPTSGSCDELKSNSSQNERDNSSEDCDGQQVVLSGDEPKYEVVTGSKRSIVLLVSVTADYAKCSCSVEEILFKDTLMFKNRVFQMVLENTGSVPLAYEWVMTLESRSPVFCSSTTALRSVKPHPLVGPRPHTAVCSRTQLRSKRTTSRPLSGREPLIDTTVPEVARSRDASKSSNKSYISLLEDEFLPFSVEPSKGTLKCGELVNVKVTFSPFDTYDYRMKLNCLIPNLDPDQRCIEVFVSARSLMPYCHLEVEESDYLSSGRRDPGLPSPVLPLDPDTKTIEFRVMGIGETCTKDFYMVNPTEQNYTFFWRKAFPSPTNLVEPIVCHTQDGFIEAGKKKQVSFSFIAAEVGVSESFWSLVIPDFDVHTLFLLVGIATEPQVYFLSAHINLKPTIKGVKTQAVLCLVNNEDIRLAFEFENETFCDGCVEKLNVQPVADILSPKSKRDISVWYTPEAPGESLFTLKCNVEKIKNPLEVSILGVCYIVEPLVTWQDVDGKRRSLRLSGNNILDFKEVSVHQATNIVFRIVNTGKISFCYQFKYDEDKLRRFGFKLKFSNKGGCVTSQSHVMSTVSCTSFKDTNLSNFEVYLEISQGPTYRMLMQGQSTSLRFQFSFYNFNFGMCIIQNPQTNSYKKELIFTNNEEKSSLLLETKYENKPHLEVSMKTYPVLPGQSMVITIIFNPLDVIQYNETLLFVINGSVQKNIQISGEGTEFMIQLVRSQHTVVELGALQVGRVVSKRIPVVNRSKVPTKITFLLEDPPADLSKNLKLVPNDWITIHPEEVVLLSVIFAPTKVMKPFSQKILMQFNKQSNSLCMVKGSCIGYEFVLDRKHLPFGAVVEGCSSTLKLVLSNVGDLGSKFTWQNDGCDGNFTISPMTGYCSPGCAVTFTVRFHPRCKMLNIRSEVHCEIENHNSLSVVLSGSCVGVPLPKEVVNFSCPVRQHDKKTVMVSNTSNHAWQLYPQVSGDFFSGAEILTVNPRTVGHYEVVYAPLTMTHDDFTHSGSVFICLPDGDALLYSLQGTAQAPEAEAKIVREITSKTNHTVLLPVTNWLQQPQRFTVTTTLVKSEKYDPVFTVTGSDFIEVAGNSTRDYKLIFNVHRECVITFKIHFTNEDTGDFQFYELTLKVEKCGPLTTIHMKTLVRVPTSHKLSLKNPLPQDVNYTISCSAPDVTHPAQISVPASSVKHIVLEYLPLIPGSSQWLVEAVCTELGSFPYKLHLEAIPAPEEKPVIFTTSLGSSTGAQIPVRNYSDAKAEFTCSVSHSDFLTEESINVPALSLGSVKVAYEPSNLNSASAILTVASPTAGEYIFPLVGKCSLPKPQGPFELKPGSGIVISFKNIFHETNTFNIAVDNPAFVLKNVSETIKSKKDTKIHVGLQPMKHLNISDTRIPVTGKLTIFCSDPSLSHITWTYYLKGILDS